MIVFFAMRKKKIRISTGTDAPGLLYTWSVVRMEACPVFAKLPDGPDADESLGLQTT